MITIFKHLSMTSGGRPVRIELSQSDANFTLIFSLYSEMGELNIESGTTAKILGTTPGGQEFQASASIASGKVTVTGSAAMTDAPGKGVYEIQLTHSGKVLHSANFFIIVEKTP